MRKAPKAPPAPIVSTSADATTPASLQSHTQPSLHRGPRHSPHEASSPNKLLPLAVAAAAVSPSTAAPASPSASSTYTPQGNHANRDTASKKSGGRGRGMSGLERTSEFASSRKSPTSAPVFKVSPLSSLKGDALGRGLQLCISEIIHFAVRSV
jgi:hypothetical protein